MSDLTAHVMNHHGDDWLAGEIGKLEQKLAEAQATITAHNHNNDYSMKRIADLTAKLAAAETKLAECQRDAEKDFSTAKGATKMNFSDALNSLKSGAKIYREGWNGKGMFLFLVNGSKFNVNRAPLLGIYPEGTSIDYRAHIDMKTVDGSIVPWVASQTDLLADDWCAEPI